MNNMKYQTFKKSKTNKFINILSVILYVIFVINLFMYIIGSTIIVVGTAMFRRNQVVQNPMIEPYSVTDMSDSTIYVDEYNDGKLYMRYTYSCNLEKEVKVAPQNRDIIVYKIIYDGEEFVSEIDDYVIPEGRHDFVFYLSKKTSIDEYKNCKRLVLNYKADKLVLSDNFKMMNEDDLHDTYAYFYTSDSTDNYIDPLHRSEMYKKIVILFWVSNSYLVLVIAKSIFLSIKIKEEKKLEQINNN